MSGPDERAMGLLECESRECTGSVLASLSADFGIAVALWSRTRGGTELAITVYFPDASSRDFSRPLEEGEPSSRSLVAEVAHAVRSYEAPRPEEVRPARTMRVSAGNYVLGALGLAAAAPALAIALTTVARNGDCTETESGDCSMPAGVTREVYIGPRTVTLLVTGTVLAGVSTYLLVKRPMRVSVSPSRTGAFVSAEGSF